MTPRPAAGWRLLHISAAAWLAAAAALAGPAGAQESPAPEDLLGELRGGAPPARPARPAAAPPATAPAAAGRPAGRSPATAPGGTVAPTAHADSLARKLARAPGKLWLYFGAVGVASILAWLGVWAVLGTWAARTAGMPVCLGTALLAGLCFGWLNSLPGIGDVLGLLLWPALLAGLVVVALWAWRAGEVPVPFAALLLAVAAFGLALWNSDAVSAIREDRSAEIAAARRRQEKARAEEARAATAPGDADIRFPPGAAATRPTAADANAPGAGAGDYDYRRGGKKRRDPNMTDANDQPLTRLADRATAEAAAAAGAVRTLPGADLIVANQLDMLNRFAARLTLVVALLAAAVEYLRRFNLTFGAILPLPLAGRAIDALWPKSHVVGLQDADGSALVELLRSAVHKGESFLAFTPEDPFPGTDRLPRLPVARLRALPKLACDVAETAFSTPLLFESAWFGRYCVVLRTRRWDDHAAARLADLIQRLRMRRHTRASAARTLNIVWAAPDPLPRETLAELAFLCRETNLRLVVASARPPEGADAECFDEICRP